MPFSSLKEYSMCSIFCFVFLIVRKIAMMSSTIQFTEWYKSNNDNINMYLLVF